MGADVQSSLHRIRPLDKNDCLFLINWCHCIRRAKAYYLYLDKQEETKDANSECQALKEMTMVELKDGIVLGIASKKGGKGGWRKRWWVLHNGYLYYFKDDFRKNKKLNGIGVAQGYIDLNNEADIVWDVDRSRTGKQDALLICTKDRTYYIQPEKKDVFYKAIDACCSHFWDRKLFDFVAMKPC